jgi:hexosaminidase
MDKPISIIPEPQQLKPTGGHFQLNASTQIIAEGPLADVANLFIDWTAPALGFRLGITPGKSNRENAILLRLDPDLTRLGLEGYQLVAGSHSVEITAPAPAGVFYGLQTLRQLLLETIFSQTPLPEQKWDLPCVEIEDAPRFPWRGTMLDVGRHFMPKEFVLRFIDLMALHKLNLFHWHLTDDQGWRIEIKKYPRLTEVGAWRKESLVGHYNDSIDHPKYDGIPHGGFYTQDEIREVIEYARQRFITILPEIEMPGHAQAIIAAYPELGNTSEPLDVYKTWGINRHICNIEESTIQFMQDVLREVMDLFPSKLIHIGGDEVLTDEWRESPAAQKRMKELGLLDEHQLQSYFLRRIEDFLSAHGHRLVGWDEILEDGLSPTAVVMSWRCNGSDAEAANSGRDVIAAPYESVYLDYYQLQNKNEQPLSIGGYTPLSKVYQFEPVAESVSEQNRAHILGVQAQLWTEYMPTPTHVEYMAFPRLCALSEIAWTNPAQKNYADFIQRLVHHQNRLDNLKVNYCKKNE